ncbi:unnamed protein product [Gongylonema pulchrum]|uniref:Uncharacterized protein n=1 Tax=Gongylonema pulchrum TaxID=637853 RepID=A0A183DX97_9BILA|nr:unnamed protein product [Gongylonema pulchrum]
MRTHTGEKPLLSDAFLECSDVGLGGSLRSICPGNLLEEQVLAPQSSLSVPTNENFAAELLRTEPALFKTVCDLLDEQVLAPQSSLSVPTNENLLVGELARTEPALFEIYKQFVFRPPATLHAEAATKQFSLQSMPCEKMECSLAGYLCQQTNVSSCRFYSDGLLSTFAVQRYSAVTTIRNA